tara:strand:- start:185 stop:1174 length:990 start_codon:yes stop_codon:yes gene_type:complete
MKEFFVGKKVLITGGLGFIGSNLARKLNYLGSNVTILDSLIETQGGNKFNIDDFKNDVDLYIGDIRDKNNLRELIKGKDILFNLASHTSHKGSMLDPLMDLDINSKAQLNLLEICKDINPNIKIIFASTRQIYGKPNYLPVDEKHSLNPPDVNGINKLSAEYFHILYQKVYKIKSVILRLTNTYGPAMRIKDAKQTFLGIWIKQLLENQPITIFGDGKQIRDFNYIDDCVNALIIASENKFAEGKIFNVGSDEKISLTDLAKLMIKVNGGGEFVYKAFPSDREKIDIGDYFSDISFFKKSLNWTPNFALEKGLKLSLDYYRRNFIYYIN